jgi:hypothetical protein
MAGAKARRRPEGTAAGAIQIAQNGHSPSIPECTGVTISVQFERGDRMPRASLIGLTLIATLAAVSCGGNSPTAPQPSDAISIGSTVPVNGVLLEKGQPLSISATVSYRLETASSAQVGMVVEDQAANVIVAIPVQRVVKGMGTATFAADLTVPSNAQKLIVYFALFADGQTKTRTIDVVEYLIRR